MTEVSVIITCFNLEKYLDECLRSVKDQTHLPEEIILVHDGCDHPVSGVGVNTYIREKNLGVARTRDEGFRLSTGDKILFLDADDVLTENFIEKCLEVKANIAYPNWLLWSHWGDSQHNNAWYEAPKKITLEKMLKQNWIPVTSMMDREVYQKVGMFNPRLPIFEDWEFWLRVIKSGFTFGKADTFLKYRQRTASRNHQKEDLKVKYFTKIRKKFL